MDRQAREDFDRMNPIEPSAQAQLERASQRLHIINLERASQRLHIINDHARGRIEVTINGVVYSCAEQITWKRWRIEPNTKVRSMKSDIWKKRPCWVKYCAFKDAVVKMGVRLQAGDHVIFHISMPTSWPQKKKALMAGSRHEQTPDIDNLFGGLLDAVFASAERGGKGDQHIHTVGSLRKVWAWEGGIEIGRKVT